MTDASNHHPPLRVGHAPASHEETMTDTPDTDGRDAVEAFDAKSYARRRLAERFEGFSTDAAYSDEWFGRWARANTADILAALNPPDQQQRAAALEEAAKGGLWGEYHKMLLELLAVIHRDGGHKTQEIGIDLSFKQAMQLSSERIAAPQAPPPDVAATGLREALAKSHYYSVAHPPIQVTLGFRTLEDRDAFLKTHVAALAEPTQPLPSAPPSAAGGEG